MCMKSSVSSAPYLVPHRVVQWWSRDHVHCWLTLWDVSSDVADSLYFSGVHGPRLQGLCYAYENHDSTPWVQCDVTAERQKYMVYDACQYLMSRGWVIKEWVRVLFHAAVFFLNF